MTLPLLGPVTMFVVIVVALRAFETASCAKKFFHVGDDSEGKA